MEQEIQLSGNAKQEETVESLFPVECPNDEPLVSARDLHAFLGVKTTYDDWLSRICEHGFSEGIDFFWSESADGCPARDALLKLGMAKGICILQQDERGKTARLYLAEVEKRFNSPEQLMARALRVADTEVRAFQQQARELAHGEKLLLQIAGLW